MKPWTKQELAWIEKNKDKIEADKLNGLLVEIYSDWTITSESRGRILGGILSVLGSEEFFRKLDNKMVGPDLFQYSDTLPDKVVIPKYLDLPAVMFRYSTIREIVLPGTLETIGTSCFEGSGLIKIEFPKPFSDIDNGAFHNCIDLKEVIFNDNLQFISMGAFQGCVSLKNLNIPNCIEIGENGFRDCSNLEKVVIGRCSILNHNAFGHCQNLRIVEIGEIDKILGDPFEDDHPDLLIFFEKNVYRADEFCEEIKMRNR